MNLETVKELLYDVTAKFFVGATVMWTEQVNTKPNEPYVTLKCNGLKRTLFPIDSAEGIRRYDCSTTLEVNLYTKGRPVTIGENVTGNYANTATSDMMDFANYLESEYITDTLAGQGVSVMFMPPVRDLTELLNDSRYRYRSMAEFSVGFEQEAGGAYGISGMAIAPNSSGGGEEWMVTEEIPAIENFEVNEETEGGMNNDEE